MSANVSHILDPPKPTQENCPILQEISDNSATPGKRLCTDCKGVNSVLPVESDSRTVDRDGVKCIITEIHYYMNVSPKHQ
jgi:hypothetical protein